MYYKTKTLFLINTKYFYWATTKYLQDRIKTIIFKEIY